MREIKFRGRKLVGEDAGKWVYGWLGTNIKGNTIIKDDNAQFPVAVDADTIGQYTGMKDCNEVEIYEGDIVFDADECGVVEWDDSKHMFIINHESGWCNPMCEYYSDDLGVTGNRYDNPELLGGADDEH